METIDSSQQLWTPEEKKVFERHVKVMTQAARAYGSTIMPYKDSEANYKFFLWQLAREDMRTYAVDVCTDATCMDEAKLIQERP